MRVYQKDLTDKIEKFIPVKRMTTIKKTIWTVNSLRNTIGTICEEILKMKMLKNGITFQINLLQKNFNYST